jgi:uncharacterized protein (TIGR03067 family)
MKTRLALFVVAILAAVGSARADQAGPPDPTADQAKDAQKTDEEKGKPAPAQQTPQPAKTDRERMVGNWFIVNDDSQRRGEMWVITEDSILMHAKDGGAIAHHYAHRLDESKDPKQIDITVSLIKGPTVGVIKGIYVLDGDELRLCLGEMGKDRPAAFPEKPKLGEVLVLRRAISGATPPAAKGAGRPAAKDAASPAAKEKPAAKTDRERMVGNWFIVNDDSQRQGEMWVITEDSILMYANYLGLNVYHYAHRLDESKNPRQIDITVSRINGPNVGVIKGIYVFDGDELRLCLGEMGKDRPAAFPEKPKLGEVLVLRRERPDAVSPVKGAAPPAKGAASPAANDAGPPTPKDAAPPPANDAQPEQKKVLSPEEAIKQRPKEKVVTVQFKVTAVQDESQSPGTGFGVGFILLKDGGNFSARLVPPAMYTIMRLDIDPTKHFTGRVVRVTGLVQPLLQFRQAEGPCWIDVTDIEHLEVLRQ